jgi:ABC-type transport system involved in multi-copper enzyme maturation permease subunit
MFANLSLSVLAVDAVDLVSLIPEQERQNWVIALVVIGLAIVGLLGFTYFTRAGIIARATTKEAVRQPVFSLSLAIGIVTLVILTYLPYFSMGDDVKMLKDCGMATILSWSILLAVWTSSTSIADEIEGKTAMTLLSKPITRRQFVVGKYVGILQATLLLLIPLSLCFLVLVYYKVGYDAREAAMTAPETTDKLLQVIQILPGIPLIFLEVMVLTAISVAISTRLPMVVNMVTCFAIFVVGHLTAVMVQAAAGGTNMQAAPEPVQAVARVIATVLPALQNYDMQTAVATGVMVPPVYLGYTALYSLCYSAALILLAFILFEDRDLA